MHPGSILSCLGQQLKRVQGRLRYMQAVSDDNPESAGEIAQIYAELESIIRFTHSFESLDVSDVKDYAEGLSARLSKRYRNVDQTRVFVQPDGGAKRLVRFKNLAGLQQKLSQMGWTHWKLEEAVFSWSYSRTSETKPQPIADLSEEVLDKLRAGDRFQVTRSLVMFTISSQRSTANDGSVS